MKPKKKKTHRALTHEKVTILGLYMQRNKTKLDGLSASEIAKRASNELRFEISPTCIESIGKVLDLRISDGRSDRKSKSDSLIHAVVNLYERLGEPVPEDLGQFHMHILRRNNRGI